MDMTYAAVTLRHGQYGGHAVWDMVAVKWSVLRTGLYRFTDMRFWHLLHHLTHRCWRRSGRDGAAARRKCLRGQPGLVRPGASQWKAVQRQGVNGAKDSSWR